METLVLVHSPLVGPSSWAACVRELRGRGRHVVVPDLTGAFAGGVPSFGDLAAIVASAAVEPGAVVLVGHSGAGPLLPAVTAALPVAAAILVDATMPHPGASFLETAPAPITAQLRAMATGRALPPWDQWFPPEVLAGLLPDPGQRAAFRAGLPRLPLAWFEQRAPVVAAWDTLPRGFLRLSPPYDTAAAEAAAHGWPVRTGPPGHLAPMTDPGAVADDLEALAALLR
jgi:hypothetical protein